MPVVHEPGRVHEMHGATFTSLASPRRGSRENSVWKVEIAPATPATPHQLTREEIFVVSSGRAAVALGGERFEVGAGDVVIVPPATDFAIEVVGEQPLRALVCFPVGGMARLADGTTFTPPWAE